MKYIEVRFPSLMDRDGDEVCNAQNVDLIVQFLGGPIYSNRDYALVDVELNLYHKHYSYKCPDRFKVKPGDWILVPARGKVSVAKVIQHVAESTHAQCEILARLDLPEKENAGAISYYRAQIKAARNKLIRVNGEAETLVRKLWKSLTLEEKLQSMAIMGRTEAAELKRDLDLTNGAIKDYVDCLDKLGGR